MASWMIAGEETERMLKGGKVIIPSLFLPVCNFEVGVSVAPSAGDSVTFNEDDKLITKYKILSVTAIESANGEISHYECSFKVDG